MFGILIMALICSPVLAVSKSDLISQYKTGDYWKPPARTADYQIPAELRMPTSWLPWTPGLPWKNNLTPVQPFSKPCIPSSPLVKPSLIPALKSCPPAIPSRPLYRAMVYCSCSPAATCDCVNPETGEHYPIGFDGQGNEYIIKPGCPCTWAD